MSENLQPTKGTMLPGVAAIAIWMLVVALMGVFAVLNGHVPRQMGLLLVLPICTLIVVGVFGLLRMKRWGWALVMAGAVTVALWCFFMFRLSHFPQTLIMGLLHMLFFLYLVRTEVRERML
jgi:hypothetical protein